MPFPPKHWLASPVAARVVPFAVFILLTFFQNDFGPAGRFWIYLGKTVAGAWMLFLVRKLIPEFRWKISPSAVVAGVAVFLIWVGLDPYYPHLKEASDLVKGWFGSAPTVKNPPNVDTWNPHLVFGAGSGLAWFFVVVRILGSALVVPPLEEIFYRSFLYRYVVDPQFERIPLGTVHRGALVVTALIFGLSHDQWLAGILCAAIYQGLVCYHRRLGDAITAHAITNLLLGAWVVYRDAWHFW
jgi:CAAX prenyl protease-like protein